MEKNSSKPLLLSALAQEPIARPPVWLMRQAGRYMAEYRALKEKHSFLELCRTPELAFEVTMQPIRAFRPDAAILFADILLPLEPMGLQIEFNPGPKIHNPLRSRTDIEALVEFDPVSEMGYLYETLRSLKRELSANGDASVERTALLGFAGAPWTLACYAIDQGPFKHFEATRILAHSDREALSLLLSKLTKTISDYLIAQIEAGADAVQLFDSWAGELSLADYEALALQPLQAIIETVKKTGAPVILYASGSTHLLPALAKAGADCISLDGRADLAAAEKILGPKIGIQGNLDPAALFAPTEQVIARTGSMLSRLQRRTGYIANLGHGVLQGTPPQNVKAFVETVQKGWKT